jgi:hypothetical protein
LTTIVYPVSWDDHIINDEVFGPILPVLTDRTLDEARLPPDSELNSPNLALDNTRFVIAANRTFETADSGRGRR